MLVQNQRVPVPKDIFYLLFRQTLEANVLHYSCDFCQRPIDPAVGIRHVVKINVFPAVDSQKDENCPPESESLGDDHLDDMHDLLERLEEQDLAAFLDDGTRALRFDLCDACRQRFLRNPLGIQSNKSFTFSDN
jgi:hypothetical protein